MYSAPHFSQAWSENGSACASRDGAAIGGRQNSCSAFCTTSAIRIDSLRRLKDRKLFAKVLLPSASAKSLNGKEVPAFGPRPSAFFGGKNYAVKPKFPRTSVNIP